MILNVIHHLAQSETLEHQRVTGDHAFTDHLREVIIETLRLERDQCVQLLERHLVVHSELDLVLAIAAARRLARIFEVFFSQNSGRGLFVVDHGLGTIRVDKLESDVDGFLCLRDGWQDDDSGLGLGCEGSELEIDHLFDLSHGRGEGRRWGDGDWGHDRCRRRWRSGDVAIEIHVVASW